MSSVGWDVVVVLAFILIGGFFAAAEMALVSLREGQIRALAKRGKRGQRAARLAHDPNRFLAAVQIGVTVATLLSGAYGAETLVGDFRRWLVHQVSPHVADVISFIVVTLIIAFFSLVLGELAPKRIALQRQERIALVAAPVLDRIAVLARPLVWFISSTVNVVVRMLGGDPKVGRGTMSSDELRDLVAGHQNLTADERHIVSEVFDAGKRQIREVLVPRTEVDFLPASMPVTQAVTVAARATHSRFPVFEDSYDDVIGFVHARDLLDPARNGSTRVGEIKRPVKMLPTSKTVMSALSEMRKDKAHLAIVVDEYGGTAGIVTLEDLVEELIGDIQDEYDVEGNPSQAATDRRDRGRRSDEPRRLRRADRHRAARRSLRDRGRLPVVSAWSSAADGRVGRTGRDPADRDRAGRPPDLQGQGRPSPARRLSRRGPRQRPK